jgi:hypothetical protein
MGSVSLWVCFEAEGVGEFADGAPSGSELDAPIEFAPLEDSVSLGVSCPPSSDALG